MLRTLVLTAVGLVLGAAADPRPRLVELQLQGELPTALAEVSQYLEEDTDSSAVMGLGYLQGHLLDRLQQQSAAIDAFTAALGATPTLSAHVRYRLALDRLRRGERSMAAGLLVVMLANDPPPELVDDAIDLLNLSLVGKTDSCRLLESWQSWNLTRRQRRSLAASWVPCQSIADPTADTVEWLTGLLQQGREDETARRAAHRLADSEPPPLDPATRLLVGLTLFEHREFDRALPFLEFTPDELPRATSRIRNTTPDDVLYALARSFFWLGEYRRAAERFDIAARQAKDPALSARALFQRGRSLALAGDWDAAVDSYGHAAKAKADSVWAASALISAMRLEWRRGNEIQALSYFAQIRAQTRWRSTLERAALFLAASDLVQQRTDRAEAWLALAQRAALRDLPELQYWRGRLAELESDPERAVDRYATLLAEWPYHPLTEAARLQLSRPELAAVAEQQGRRYSESQQTRDLVRAVQLLAADDPDANSALAALRDRWLRSTISRSFIDIQSPPVERWPLWQIEPRTPEDQLLALGITEAYSPALRRWFPVADTGLALVGSRLLSASGLHRRSLYYAEIVSQRIPNGMPELLLDPSLRRLLYPRPFDFTILQQSSRFGVDADLLRAIIREESRFDPFAVSSASARGLTQFVLPTARRLGTKLGWSELDPWNLHDPDTAITLGAAYLAELLAHSDGRTLPAVAAYNAGEDQARLWQSYCFTQEEAEYFTKVGFTQTRTYLEKVESSRLRYHEIYADRPRAQSETDSRTSRTGGNDS